MINLLKRKFWTALTAIVIAVFAATGFSASSVVADSPDYDVSGSYVFDIEYLGGHYLHDVTLEQDAFGSVMGSGGHPAGGAHTYEWAITSGSVSANILEFSADYTLGDDALTPLTTMTVSGTIAADGSISGTWSDNYQGGERSGTFMTSDGTASPINYSTVVVTGDTSPGENQPGWMFNRDASTDTPFEFNEDQSSIGDGSLYVMPIGATGADKFIGELFLNEPITNVGSVSYDFMIGSGGDSSDAGQFYMNVYANYGVSDDNKFYDCRYNVVPTTGSTGAFTTVTFDPSQAYPVTTSGTSPQVCPAIPADMDDFSAGSTIRAIAINVGDTSISDEGLDGYLDNVVVMLADGTTTYDFEMEDETPFERSATITSPTSGEVVSDGSLELAATLVDEDGDDTVQWAVRSGTCDAPTGTVAGNVDGHTDTSTFDGSSFSATVDSSEFADGTYCFVFNPSESEGDTEIRETVQFTIDNTEEPPTGPLTKDDCKNGGWMAFTDPSFRNQGQCIAYVNHQNRNE